MKENPSSFLWESETYDEVSNSHEEWARNIISSKKWIGNETIMDAGCDSGRITKILTELVPFGKMYAIDNDQKMIKKAKDNLKVLKCKYYSIIFMGY